MKALTWSLVVLGFLITHSADAAGRRPSTGRVKGEFHGVNFDNVTFRAAAGYCDLHLEVVSVDANRTVMSMADSISEEKNEANGGSCRNQSNCNGSVTLTACEPSGLCYAHQDQAKSAPDLTLLPDGNVLVDYGSATSINLIKLTRSAYSRWWRCGR